MTRKLLITGGLCLPIALALAQYTPSQMASNAAPYDALSERQIRSAIAWELAQLNSATISNTVVSAASLDGLSERQLLNFEAYSLGVLASGSSIGYATAAGTGIAVSTNTTTKVYTITATGQATNSIDVAPGAGIAITTNSLLKTIAVLGNLVDWFQLGTNVLTGLGAGTGSSNITDSAYTAVVRNLTVSTNLTAGLATFTRMNIGTLNLTNAPAFLDTSLTNATGQTIAQQVSAVTNGYAWTNLTVAHASAVTNGYGWTNLTVAHASAVTNGYSWTNLTVTHASAVTNGYAWTNLTVAHAGAVTNGYPWTNVPVANATIAASATGAQYATNFPSGNALNIGTIGCSFSGGGTVIATNTTSEPLVVNSACTVTSWTLTCQPVANVILDIWKTNNSVPLSAYSFTGNQKPSISTTNWGTGSTISNWTNTISAGDVLIFNIISNSAATNIHLSVKVTR